MKDQRRIRLIMTNKVYKKRGNDFVIPIHNVNGIYQTGQPDVSFEEATGKVPVSKEAIAKYGYIINPENSYKAQDMKWYDLSDSSQNAIVELLKRSGKIAESKQAYDKARMDFDGYLEDVQVEAKVRNDKRKDRFDAEEQVRAASLDDMIRTALLLNYKVKGFAVNPSKTSSDLLYDKVYEQCELNPVIVKSCFKKFNPNINHESFGVELLHYNILKRDREGAIYDGATFICTTLDRLRDYLSDNTNATLVGKWGNLLKAAKNTTGVDVSSIESIAPENLFDSSKVDPATQIKAALFSGDITLARRIANDCKRIMTYAQVEELESLIDTHINKQEVVKELEHKQKEAKINQTADNMKFKLPSKPLTELSVQELQELIGQNKHNGWALSKVEDKENYDSLLEYINSKINS